MSNKRTLVKQKVTYGSVGDGNLHDSDDDFSGKRTITKRVSFESHELSESDSDAENSLGRINRTTGRKAGDSLDGLFRETSTKERENSAGLRKRTSEESHTSKDKGEPKPAARPRPTISPRRTHFEGHSVATSQKSSDEDDDDVSSTMTYPARTKEAKERHPVAPPKTSPQQHQENRSPLDMTFPKPVARERPTLSSREGHLKLFEKDPDVEEYEQTKNVKRDSGIFEHERSKNVSERPMVPVRRNKTLEETRGVDTERDARVYESERTKNVPTEKPMAPSRRKQILEEIQEKLTREKDDEVYEYERTKNFREKPMAPSRGKKTLEETNEIQNSRPQIPIIRTSTFEDDGPFQNSDIREIEQSGNLRHGVSNNVKGRPVISVTRADSSEESEDEVDSGKVLYRKDSFGRQKYDKKEVGGYRTLTDTGERSAGVPPRPSPRSRGMVQDNSVKARTELEEDVKHAKRPGSAPVMKKASSLDTLSSRQESPSKKGPSGPNEHGAQRMQLKKSLTPQRPLSGKKGSLLAELRQKAHSDITNTFEEHVAPTENVISTASDDKGLRKKGTVDTGSGRAKPQRSGPLKANQEIDKMTRSSHRIDTPTERWAYTKSHRGSLTPKRASSMTDLRGNSPEPWGGDSSARSSQHSGLMDTSSIRQAVFDEWKSKKSARLKEQAASKSAEKKKQEEKEQEERERKKMAKRAFEIWNETKQEKIKEANAKKKKLMEKELEKQTEKNLKARDAKKYFESWKARKHGELKEQHHKKKEEEREKKKKEEEEKQDVKKSSQKAFENWKNSKDDRIKEDMKKKRKEEKEKTIKQEDEKYERSIQCAERYQEWVEKKGKPRRGPPTPTLTQRSWCPSGRKSGNFIPEKVGDVIQKPAPNRSRTMSGSYYFKSNKF